MRAISEKVIAHGVQKDPQWYRRNGHQSKLRKLKYSLGTIAYRFAQLVDQKSGKTFLPLGAAGIFA